MEILCCICFTTIFKHEEKKPELIIVEASLVTYALHSAVQKLGVWASHKAPWASVSPSMLL